MSKGLGLLVWDLGFKRVRANLNLGANSGSLVYDFDQNKDPGLASGDLRVKMTIGFIIYKDLSV